MRITSCEHSAKFFKSHSKLMWRVALNELRARYAGSFLGLGWAILYPLVMMSIYAAVYLVIFQVRVPNLSSLQYVLLVFSGLVPFLMTSESLVTGVSSIVANKAVLSNTVFPVDLAPPKAVLLSQVPMVVGFLVITGVLLLTGNLRWTILLLPLVWGMHLLWLVGLTWFLSLVNLLFRDLQNLISLLMMVIMVSSPIAFTPEMVPATLRLILAVNPFAYFVFAYQDIMIYGRFPSWQNSTVIIVMSVGLFLLGGHFFIRAKRGLIDYV